MTDQGSDVSVWFLFLQLLVKHVGFFWDFLMEVTSIK